MLSMVLDTVDTSKAGGKKKNLRHVNWRRYGPMNRPRK